MPVYRQEVVGAVGFFDDDDGGGAVGVTGEAQVFKDGCEPGGGVGAV